MSNSRMMQIVLPLLLVPAIASAAPKQPDAGSDDCYNRATQTCNREHPGKDLGDAGYRQCINDTLDWCDANEPASHAGGLLPALDLHGRFVDARGSSVESLPVKGGKRYELRCIEVDVASDNPLKASRANPATGEKR